MNEKRTMGKERLERPRVRYDERKPLRIGEGSVAITLPKDWVEKQLGTRNYDHPLPVMFDNYLLVVPPDTTPDERVEVEKFLLELEEKRESRRKSRK